MMMRKKFNVETLDRVLLSIAKILNEEVNAYLLGGLAMAKQGAKLATKDIDIVFRDEDTMHLFIDAASKVGFRLISELPQEYLDLGTKAVLEGDDGVRFDVFLRIVCNGLVLSSTMMERGKKIVYDDKLCLILASFEDIFLFKSVTTRPDDLDDMSALTGPNFNWETVEKEAREQRDSWKWMCP